MMLAIAFLAALASRDPAPPVAEVGGKELFRSHCAACHGMDGKGNGPRAWVLSVPVPDLTKLSERAYGRFPARRVERIIWGGKATGDVHQGASGMPAWGPAFSAPQWDRDLSPVRMRNLVGYIRSLQGK